MGTSAFSLSAIIPTKDRRDVLLDAVGSIAAQTVLPQEIIIVDQTREPDGAEDRVRSVLPRSVRLNYIWNPRIEGGAIARNCAIDRAGGDILLFLDDDVTLYPDFIQHLLSAYNDLPEASGISGVPDNYQPPGTFYRVWSAIFMRGPFRDDRQPVYWNASQLKRPVPVSRMTGAMMSFRSKDIGGVRFDQNLRGVSDGEDVDFCLRLHRKYFLHPECKLTHHFSPVGRDSGHWTGRHARSNAYLFFRNWRAHKLAYAWMRAGWYLAAFAGCASRRSLAPLRTLRAGIVEGIERAQPGMSSEDIAA